MNYPDLETCKAIAVEFPESESVWIRNKVYYRQLSVRKRDYDGGPHDEIFAPAPTCEELGEWLRRQDKEVLWVHPWVIIDMKSLFDNGFKHDLTIFEELVAENETQARAEAVKLILEAEQ